MTLSLAMPGCGGGSADGEALELAVVSSLERLTLDSRVDSGDSSRASLTVARGEREGLQLVIDEPAGREVRLSLRESSAAGSPLPAGWLRVYEARTVSVREASPGGTTGEIYDPLVPVEGGRVGVRDGRAVIWLDVRVPRSAKAGSYRAELQLTSEGQSATLQLTVQAGAAVLPARPRLASSIGLDRSQLERLEGDGSPAMVERYTDELARARLSAADLSLQLPVQVTDAFSATAEGRRLARFAGADGVASIRVPLYETYPFEDPLGADRTATVQYVRSFSSYLERRGWLDRAYTYVIDEPKAEDPARAAQVVAWQQLLAEADPRVPMILTADPHPAFGDGIDIWVPNVREGFERSSALAASLGPFWLYPSISTRPPHPALFLDDLRPSGRALGWLARKSGARGLLYWSATHWHDVDSPWTDTATYREPGAVGNGDGSLLYPGRELGVDGPVPSVRLLQLRDGIEDYDLMAGVDGARVAGTLVTSADDWQSDPQRAQPLLDGLRRSPNPGSGRSGG